MSNSDGVLLVDEELLDSTGFRGVDSDINLVGFNGCNFLILLDVVADLYSTGLDLNWQQRLWVHTRFDHCFRVPSVMDSAISGTLTIFSARHGGSVWRSDHVNLGVLLTISSCLLKVDRRGAGDMCWFPCGLVSIGKKARPYVFDGRKYRGCDERMVEERDREPVDRALSALGERAAYLEAVRETRALAGRRELPAAKRRRHWELDMIAIQRGEIGGEKQEGFVSRLFTN